MLPPMARQDTPPPDPEDGEAPDETAGESAGARIRAAAGAAGARAWATARAVGAHMRPPVVRYGPLVLLWLAGLGLILSEFLTYREIVAVTVVPEGGITKGGEHHGYALALLGLASLPMSFGAVIGRSRPAALAVAVLGGLALAIIAIFDVRSLDDTGLIGRTYDLAEANPGPGFWVSVACAVVLLAGGLLLLRSRVAAARAESDARRDERRSRRAVETEVPPPPDEPGPEPGSTGSRAAGARRPSRRR
jgi:hypothetical protein